MDIRQAIGFITGKAAKHPYPEHMQDARKIAADGIVLLKNEGDLLPLAEKELALFGAAQWIPLCADPALVMLWHLIR